MQLFAHRGASDLAPENSMAAFELALIQQCDGIELDVRLMSGQVVVMHDASVDRTTNGSGLVDQLSSTQWRQLDVGNGEVPPSLRQVLERVSGCCEVNIELKSADVVGQVAAEIAYAIHHFAFKLPQLCVSAFDHRLLMALKDIIPHLNIAPLISSCPVALSQLAYDMGACALHSHTETTDAQLVNDAHESGMAIRVFTVKQADDLLRLKQIGVDAVFVNDVTWARKVLTSA
tara:strand:+ start:472 stop:1167 length:696 start_codon:yes stop_codon:yes gene_type:complete